MRSFQTVLNLRIELLSSGAITEAFDRELLVKSSSIIRHSRFWVIKVKMFLNDKIKSYDFLFSFFSHLVLIDLFLTYIGETGFMPLSCA